MSKRRLPRLTVPVSTAVLLVSLLLVGCSNKEAREESERREQAAAEAEILGQEIFDLVDHTMAYQSSHSGRLPRRLRDLGIDSLTPSTKRWLTVEGRTPRITVAYRRPARHALGSCSGTDAVLEDLALEGAFELECTLSDGAAASFRVTLVP